MLKYMLAQTDLGALRVPRTLVTIMETFPVTKKRKLTRITLSALVLSGLNEPLPHPLQSLRVG